jgi:hypothetical protein
MPALTRIYFINKYFLSSLSQRERDWLVEVVPEILPRLKI